MIVTYFCKNCDKEIKKNISSGKPDFKINCPDCNSIASRKFGNIALQKEDDSVSGAIQMMLYSRKPSQE